MSQQTIEVEIDPSGRVRPLDPRIPVPAGPALLTPLGTRVCESTSHTHTSMGDWHDLVGALAGSPNWREDPQMIQQRLRDDWR